MEINPWISHLVKNKDLPPSIYYMNNIIQYGIMVETLSGKTV